MTVWEWANVSRAILGPWNQSSYCSNTLCHQAEFTDLFMCIHCLWTIRLAELHLNLICIEGTIREGTPTAKPIYMRVQNWTNSRHNWHASMWWDRPSTWCPRENERFTSQPTVQSAVLWEKFCGFLAIELTVCGSEEMGIKNVSATMEATVNWLQLRTEQRQTCSDKERDEDGEQNWELEERNIIDK